jgi:hypothetical protein
LHSAVSQIWNLRADGQSGALGRVGRPADCKSAIRQIENLRYGLPTTFVLHALVVSAFILLGAKLGQRFGSKRFFQASTALFLGPWCSWRRVGAWP